MTDGDRALEWCVTVQDLFVHDQYQRAESPFKLEPILRWPPCKRSVPPPRAVVS
jgi:hypothetical protein